jgi:hypothetical protein
VSPDPMLQALRRAHGGPGGVGLSGGECMGWPEVVVPLVGMVTTLIGTFAGIFAGIRTERERWEKEQLTRFHPDRYAKYKELLKNADKVIRTPFDTPEEAELLEAMNESYAHIQMLSSKPVREAAEAFYRISGGCRTVVASERLEDVL